MRIVEYIYEVISIFRVKCLRLLRQREYRRLINNVSMNTIFVENDNICNGVIIREVVKIDERQ